MAPAEQTSQVLELRSLEPSRTACLSFVADWSDPRHGVAYSARVQEGSSSLVRNWICWGTIAGAFLVALALSHIIAAQFEQMVSGMGFDLRRDPGVRPKPHDWLIATSVGVAALFLAKGIGDLFATHRTERNRTVATVRSLEVLDG